MTLEEQVAYFNRAGQRFREQGSKFGVEAAEVREARERYEAEGSDEG